MIRSLGFLTGIVVTGTAVWALSDGVAAKAALDSLSAYLAESDGAAESGTAVEETHRRILPPAAIMSRQVEAPTMPAATRAASPASGVARQDGATPPDTATGSPSASTPSRTEVMAQATDAESAPGATNMNDVTDAAGMAGPKPSGPMAAPGADGEPGPSERTGDAGTRGSSGGPETAGERPAPPALEDDPAPDPGQELEADGNWFAFWTPFRSRASADGFAQHLIRATGQDIRVLRIGPGEYRVAFFHNGEEDRQRHLASLESASGLELGGEL
ncbi:MAG: hypothetical protein PVG91_05255 [Gammaproteobacteria bacterium]|jgi:hypothetical protein